MAKPIFMINVEITIDDYAQYSKSIRAADDHDSDKLLALAPIVLALGVIGCFVSNEYVIGLVMVACCGVLYYFKIINDRKAIQEAFRTSDKAYTLEFFNDRVYKTEAPELQYTFYKLWDILETESIICFMTSKKNGLIIPKRYCDAALLEFIKTKKLNLPPKELREENATPTVVSVEGE